MSKDSPAEGGPWPKAVVFGCAGAELSREEAAFFRAADPLGFIFFKRNCVRPEQVRRLVGDLRDCVGRADAPVLIDQEGGRVARLQPPHWRKVPAAACFGALAARGLEAASRAARLNARLIAAELNPLGITVDCAPVLDVPAPGSHKVIGDRSLARDPDLVGRLGQAVCEGLLAGGVLPVLKHIPGHGRATADSHISLPVVTAPAEELEAVDFLPFAKLRDAALAMTAHVVYTAFDDRAPATQSTRVIDEIIRRRIGFSGLLLTDDISMGALGGRLGARAARALEAGCDVVLHCNADRAEMESLAEAIGALSSQAAARLRRAQAALREPDDIDFNILSEQVNDLISEITASG